MVVSIDAGKVPTRANERVDDDGNKNYDREYRDAKVATVSALEWDEKRAEAHCTKTSCVTGIEHADQFFPRIEVEMKRRSAELATLILVVLGDGASWIWDRVADLAEPGQQVWYILDFWHACDHLAKICRVLYGEDTKPFTKLFPASRRFQTVPSRVASACQPVMLVSASGERQRCRLSRFSRGVHRQRCWWSR